MVNGRGLKSINHYGNKQVAKRRSKLAKGIRSSLFIRNVQDKRNQKVDDYLHKLPTYRKMMSTRQKRAINLNCRSLN